MSGRNVPVTQRGRFNIVKTPVKTQRNFLQTLEEAKIRWRGVDWICAEDHQSIDHTGFDRRRRVVIITPVDIEKYCIKSVADPTPAFLSYAECPIQPFRELIVGISAKRVALSIALVALLSVLLVPLVASAQSPGMSSLIVKVVAGLSVEQQAALVARVL